MKKSIFSFASLLIAAIALLSIAPASGLHAAVPQNASVKYLGVQDDKVLFTVAFENPDGKKVTVSVLDENGNALFQDVFTDRKFDKKFKLPKTETGKSHFCRAHFERG